MARERRRSRRTRKRLKVQYGVKGLDLVGFALDVSLGGLFLTANKLLPIGSRVHLMVEWPEGILYGEGEIVRHRIVPANLRIAEPQGMGVRFIPPSELIERLLHKPGDATRVTLELPSAAAVDEVLRQQLSRGVLIVPVTEPVPAVSDRVEFAVRLTFLPSVEEIPAAGRVLQVLSNVGVGSVVGRAAVLEIEGPSAIADAIRKVVAPG